MEVGMRSNIPRKTTGIPMAAAAICLVLIGSVSCSSAPTGSPIHIFSTKFDDKANQVCGDIWGAANSGHGQLLLVGAKDSSIGEASKIVRGPYRKTFDVQLGKEPSDTYVALCFLRSSKSSGGRHAVSAELLDEAGGAYVDTWGSE
jgi:hypothetical protein